jgi:hypothetical protein
LNYIKTGVQGSLGALLEETIEQTAGYIISKVIQNIADDN